MGSAREGSGPSLASRDRVRAGGVPSQQLDARPVGAASPRPPSCWGCAPISAAPRRSRRWPPRSRPSTRISPGRRAASRSPITDQPSATVAPSRLASTQTRLPSRQRATRPMARCRLGGEGQHVRALPGSWRPPLGGEPGEHTLAEARAYVATVPCLHISGRCSPARFERRS